MAKLISTEDGNLASKTLVSSTNKTYSDIDLSLELNQTTGDIFKKKDMSSVQQAIKNLILTNRFEKPFQPDFGGNLQGLLFDLSKGSETEYEIKNQIKNTIERYEPRCNVEEIEIFALPETHSLNVKLKYSIVGTNKLVTLSTNVSRLR